MKNINKTILDLSSEEIKEWAEKAAEKYISEVKEKISFTETEEFNSIIEELRTFLSLNESLSSDGIFYFETETSDMERKMIQIVDDLSKAQKLERLGETDCMFPETCYKYEDLIFCIMIGQGAIYSARLEKDFDLTIINKEED